MLKIRLSKTGKKNRAAYRIVVVERRSGRDGKSIENLGFYNPSQKDKLNVKKDRLKYWLSQGAISSDAVQKLIK